MWVPHSWDSRSKGRMGMDPKAHLSVVKIQHLDVDAAIKPWLYLADTPLLLETTVLIRIKICSNTLKVLMQHGTAKVDYNGVCQYYCEWKINGIAVEFTCWGIRVGLKAS